MLFERIFLTKHKPESAHKNCRDPDLDSFLAVFRRCGCIEGPVGQDAELRIAAGAVAARQEWETANASRDEKIGAG